MMSQYELFALQTGDAVQDFYGKTVIAEFAFTNLFFIIYIFLAISLIQNIFLVIVEDSYLTVKYSRSTDWLLKEEQEKKKRSPSIDSTGDDDDIGDDKGNKMT